MYACFDGVYISLIQVALSDENGRTRVRKLPRVILFRNCWFRASEGTRIVLKSLKHVCARNFGKLHAVSTHARLRIPVFTLINKPGTHMVRTLPAWMSPLDAS